MNEEPIAVYEAKLSKEEFLQGAYFLLRKSPRVRNLRVLGCVLPVLAGLFYLFQAFVWEEIPGGRPVVHISMPNLFNALFMALVAVGIFFATRRGIARAARNIYAMQKIYAPENARRQILFFTDRQEILQDGVAVMHVSYQKVRGVWYYGPLCLVLFSPQAFGIYRTDGFTRGNFETVLRAMEQQAGRKLLKHSKTQK